MSQARQVASPQDFIARREIVIHAPPEKVWRALTEPALVGRVMFGAEVRSDWRQGSPITYRGEWQGKPYEDKGEILQITPERRLKTTHFSPLTGKPDKPENYHVVDIQLQEEGGTTRVTVAQSNNPTEDAAEHSAKNWELMLGNLKEVAEGL
jgi:uncharacterized protein YndB with AHSA1/START domain